MYIIWHELKCIFGLVKQKVCISPMFVCRAVWRWRSGKRGWSLRMVRSPTTAFRRSQLPPQVCPGNMGFYDHPRSNPNSLFESQLTHECWLKNGVLLVFWKLKVYTGWCWCSADHTCCTLSSFSVLTESKMLQEVISFHPIRTSDRYYSVQWNVILDQWDFWILYNPDIWHNIS